MGAMRFPPRLRAYAKGLDASRVVAAAMVLSAHVVLVLLLHTAMRVPDALDDERALEHILEVEFLPDVRATPSRRASPAWAPALPAPRTAIRARKPAERAPPRSPSTSAVFLDDAQVALPLDRAPSSAAGDVFDPSPVHKPFAQPQRLASNWPKPVVIHLPDRPSSLQRYWAVPEGENLQGRAARKVPLLGLLLVATGAIGGPVCPPKSEHPDCLRRLLEDASP